MIPHARKHDRLAALRVGLEEPDLEDFRAHRPKLRLDSFDRLVTIPVWHAREAL